MRALGRLAARRRGQAGVTLVEVLTASVVGVIIIVPVTGVLILALSVREPATLSNSQDAQIGVFRTRVQRDWAKGMIIKTNVPFWDETECSGGASDEQPDRTKPEQNPRIAIQTLQTDNGTQSRKRVVYFLRPTPAAEGGKATAGVATGGANSWDLVRRECRTLDQDPAFRCEPPGPLIWNLIDDASPNVDGQGPDAAKNWPAVPRSREDYGCWRRDMESVTAAGGSVEVMVRRLSTFEITTCNNYLRLNGSLTDSTRPPYAPCDATITITGIDGKMVTFSLMQQQWRFRSVGPSGTPATTIMVPDDGPR